MLTAPASTTTPPTPTTSYHTFRNRAGQWVCNCLRCGKQTVNKNTATCADCKRRGTCKLCGASTSAHDSRYCKDCYKKSSKRRGVDDPTPAEIVVRAAEARELFADVGRFPRGGAIVLLGIGEDDDGGEDAAEKRFRAARRAAIAADLHEAEKRRYDIATLLAFGMEECFLPEGGCWSIGREDWRQRSGDGMDAEGFATAYVANGGLGRLAG